MIYSLFWVVLVFGIASLMNRRSKYVREQIDTKTPVEIGIEMLDEIISEDPRSTQQGIGGDNMMIMVIDLQPQQRAYQ
jgi:protein phosphatase/protein phosphatase 2C family protein 2/3